MAVSRKAMTEGIRTENFVNPSVSCADSSLCTREPWVLPHQCNFRQFLKNLRQSASPAFPGGEGFGHGLLIVPIVKK